MNEWMNEWMNEYMNKWMDESILAILAVNYLFILIVALH